MLFADVKGLEPLSRCLLFGAAIFKVDSNHTVPNKPESNGILANNTVAVLGGIEPPSPDRQSGIVAVGPQDQIK